MALALHALKALAPHLKGAQVLSLGYPDILATEEEIEEIFGVRLLGTVKYGVQHGVERPLVETQGLLRALGSTLECVDIYRTRGIERILDLNEPHDLGQFDLVIDPGTTEHCFNIGQAVMNAASAVRVGGRIYHSPPLSMMNHGFYNVCPTMMWDFYTQNGWVIETLEARHRACSSFSPITTEGAASSRYAKVPPEAGLVCMARRVSGAALKWPVQGKYLRMHAEMRKRAAA